MCLKKYVEDYESPWKKVLDFYLERVNGKRQLRCNFDAQRLPISLPA